MNKQYSVPQQTLTDILIEMIRDHVRKYDKRPTRGFCNINDYRVLARENKYPDIDINHYDFDFRFHGVEFYIVHNPCAKLSLVV